MHEHGMEWGAWQGAEGKFAIRAKMLPLWRGVETSISRRADSFTKIQTGQVVLNNHYTDKAKVCTHARVRTRMHGLLQPLEKGGDGSGFHPLQLKSLVDAVQL